MRRVDLTFFFANAPETERGLNSGLAVRHKISARLLEIKTGEEPWSISVFTGAGAQVAGVSTQHF